MERILIQLFRQLREDTTIEISTKFRNLCTDEDRIKYALDLMSTYDIIPQVHIDIKNGETSEKFRKQGNKVYVSEPSTAASCVEVLKLYTQSIAHAPCSSEQLALAYANRSAILFKLHKYEECIKDVDRALELPYPTHLRSKVNARKTECLRALQQQKTFSKDIDKSKLDDKFCPFRLKTYNNEIPCASDAVSIKYSKDYGRHVVATRDIDVGETIVYEKCYSSILSNKKLHTHCSYCLNVCWANIPCNNCTYAMYCSEKCRTVEWKKYHDMECAVFPSLLNLKLLKMDLFALRLAIQAVRECSIDDLRKELAEIDSHTDPRTKGFSKNGVYESNRYRSLLSLATNTEKRLDHDLLRRSLESCFILYFLATCTNIFGSPLENNLSLLRLNPDVTFFGGLLLRHEQMIPTNCHTSMELYGLNVVERNVMMLPFCSLINHRCSPNITRCTQGKRMTIIALYPIKSGEQIFDNYGPQYEITPRVDRQRELLSQYKFKCNCLMCQEDWPLYYGLMSYKTLVTDSAVRRKINSVLKTLDKNIVAVSASNIADNPHILPELVRAIEVLYDLVPMPCLEMSTVLETVKRIYDLQGITFELPKL